ncbi:hypothetical protein ACQP2P_11235 [Dactylosporangium sp. CA-139114]|uniref:hypothetical protein n=1 Tax=Dactylosporangium sp. CA-139114 TaxID=3239931 RepID=UPI003D95A311
MSAPTTETTTTADAVARVLADHPDGITVKDLAAAAGIGASTASKTLTAMENDGTATRRPGPANGNRKPADLWHPATGDTTPNATPADDTTTTPTDEETTMPAPDTTTTAAPAAPDATEDTAPADATPAPDADGTTADDTTADENADDEAPTPAPARKPNLRVLLMAGVLESHPDGVSAAEAITESGLATGVGDNVLIAMEAVGVAERHSDDDGPELWFLTGDGDLGAVDPDNAPTHVTCHACGHASPIRRAYALGRQPLASRAPAPRAVRADVNSDGSTRLGKNELRNMVEAFMRTLGPGHPVTPGTVGRELGRSPGAVNNAMEKLSHVVTRVSDSPVMFETLPNLPAPSAEVAAHMTVPVTTAPASDTATADANTDDATTEDADTTEATTAAPATDATTDADTAESADTADAPAVPVAA